MTDDRSSHNRRIESSTADVERFRQKFEGSNSKYAQRIIEPRGKLAKKPGVMEKLRARANRTGRTIRIWGIGNPAKDDPDEERITYKVRGGKLTAIDKDGNIVMEKKERGLEKYNGLTLQGEPGKKGDIELKGSWWNRLKLQRGNQYVTPRERREAASDKVQGLGYGIIGFFIPKRGEEKSQHSKDSNIKKILKMRFRRNQGNRGLDWERRKEH